MLATLRAPLMMLWFSLPPSFSFSFSCLLTEPMGDLVRGFFLAMIELATVGVVVEAALASSCWPMEAEEAVRRAEGLRGPIGGLAADAVLLRLVVLVAGAGVLKVDVEPDKLW